MAILALFLLAGLFAPVLAPYDPYEIDLEASLRGPGGGHWLGRDELGRDLLSRIIYGARLSLVIGVIAVAIGATVGVPVGALSGYLGGRVDLFTQRAIDVMLAFPGILLAIVLVAILGVGLVQVMVAVGIVSIPVYARLVRGQVLSLREQEFVVAARALGARPARVGPGSRDAGVALSRARRAHALVSLGAALPPGTPARVGTGRRGSGRPSGGRDAERRATTRCAGEGAAMSARSPVRVP
ncbi:MAG: ABC transporter permease [Candidatus Rokubacteria bacterium]|nr:ABC transporter permease [Candidatus Rokubacteria bacterium]